MTHVDDWLDDPRNKKHVAHGFLEHCRQPAIHIDYHWLAQNRLFVTWRGKVYECVGASRMGDVWIKRTDGDSGAHYDHRVDIADLSDWEEASSSNGQDRALSRR